MVTDLRRNLRSGAEWNEQRIGKFHGVWRLITLETILRWHFPRYIGSSSLRITRSILKTVGSPGTTCHWWSALYVTFRSPTLNHNPFVTLETVLLFIIVLPNSNNCDIHNGITKMCTVTYFEHKTCKHIWAVVTAPCGPGMGFFTCPFFCDGTAKMPPKHIRTRSRACPRCDLAGVYDRNFLRMVEDMGWGVKWGTGPGKDDWGFEVKCGKGGCAIL